MGFPMISHGFPMISHGFPMISHGFSHDFPLHLHLVREFPKDQIGASCASAKLKKDPGHSMRNRSRYLAGTESPRDGTVLEANIYPLVNVYVAMENHNFKWENSLFLWPCSIAMLVYQRVINGKFRIPKWRYS